MLNRKMSLRKLEKILKSFFFFQEYNNLYSHLYMLFSGVGATLPGLERRGSSALPHPSCSCKTLLLNIILILSTFILHSSKTIEIADC
jgi:hypothetical protein